jgi:hypothetical protein
MFLGCTAVKKGFASQKGRINICSKEREGSDLKKGGSPSKVQSSRREW